MTIFLIYCNSVISAAVLVFFASTAAGHSVHSHEDGLEVSNNTISQLEPSVDELVRQYSLLGDDSLLEQAQLQLPPEGELRTVQELLQATWVAQADHEFVAARTLIERILSAQPNNGQAWLLEAAIADVLGDQPAARRACGKVLLSVSPDAAMVCFASLADTEQHKRVAYERLNGMLSPDVESRLAAWRFSVQAELARELGYTQEAEALFLQAIAIFPAVQTRSALMDLYLDQGRYKAVLVLGAQHDTVPAIAVRRLLAQRGLGEDIGAQIAQLNGRFGEWLNANDYRHAREMAMFYLDIEPRADLAFKIATENARLQREPEDLVLLHRASKLRRAATGI